MHNSSPPARADMVIIGAGIAGCALAALLAASGLEIVLLEANALPDRAPGIAADLSAIDPRVSALSSASQQLLRRAGAWHRIPDGAFGAYSSMCVWEEDGTAQIDFHASELHQDLLGHIVENRWLTGALLAAIDEYPNVLVCAPQRLQGVQRIGQRLRLQLESGACVETALLVGADGAHSKVRHCAAIAHREWDCEQRAIVATIRTSATHRQTAWQCFMQTGPLALLPLADEHICSIVWSADEDVAMQLLQLDDGEFRTRLERASEHRLGRVLEVSARRAFALRQLHAETYAAAQIVLVADAAHVIHPLAGQGINLGLADVRVLSEEIIRAGMRGLSPGDTQVLGRYQRRRRGENSVMLRAMDGFRLLYGDRRAAVRIARNIGLAAVHRLAPLKRQLMRQALGS